MGLNSKAIDSLKVFAFFCMTIDHFYKFILVENYFILQVLGRLAFPIFAFLIAYNFINNTHNKNKMIMRIFFFAIGSELIMMSPNLLTDIHYKNNMNILFTLSYGLILHQLYPSFKHIPSLKEIIFIMILLYLSSFVDYQYYGVILVYIFTKLLASPSKGVHKALYPLFAFLFIQPNDITTPLLVFVMLFAMIILYLIAINHQKINHFSQKIDIPHINKYFYYIYYPAHYTIFILYYITNIATES